MKWRETACSRILLSDCLKAGVHEDSALRIPGCPGLYPESWKRVLESEGWHSVFFPAEAAHELSHQIIAAKSNGIVRQKRLKQGLENGPLRQSGTCAGTSGANNGAKRRHVFNRKKHRVLENVNRRNIKNSAGSN